MLTDEFAIDYEDMLCAARAEAPGNVALFLQEKLLLAWRGAYTRSAARPVNLVQLRVGTFGYICDLYSRLEATGEIPYDQTIADRVVAVYGTSCRPDDKRNASQTRDGIDSTENFVSERDNGHFMAHCIGGGLEFNVFSQDRRLNRGWSAQGKIYRQMETYCYERPGTFCFSRPIYADGSSVPCWLEFGLLRSDETLWIELFDN